MVVDNNQYCVMQREDMHFSKERMYGYNAEPPIAYTQCQWYMYMYM